MIVVLLFILVVAVPGAPLHRLLLRLAGRRPLRRTRGGAMPSRPPVMSERTDPDGTRHVW